MQATMKKYAMKKIIGTVLSGALIAIILPGAAFAAPMDMSGMAHETAPDCIQTCDATVERQTPLESKHCAICFDKQNQREDKVFQFATKKIAKKTIFERTHRTETPGVWIIGARYNLFKGNPGIDLLKTIRKRE